MTTLITLFRLLAFSQVVLTLMTFLRGRNSLLARATLAGLCTGVLAYLVAPLVPYPSAAGVTVGVLGGAVPMFLWAACRLFFADDLSLPGSGLALAAGAVATVAVGEAYAARVGRFPDGAEAVLVRWLPQAIKLGFVAAAIHIAAAGREADLVEPRRRVRRWFSLALGLMVATVIVVEAATAFRVPAGLEALGTFVMFCLAVGLNLVLLSPDPAFELRPPAPRETAPSDDPLLRALERAMLERRAYADHDLRIGGLARQLSVPEHRLRETINGQLGHRNFNHYVNRFRIEEAARRLAGEPDQPVITIALESGFRSLSAFNRAFRDLEGCTPTEYRRRSTGSSNR